MKFRAEQNQFTEAVSWGTRSVGARASLPALAGVLLEAGDDRLICRATDLEVSTEISVPVQVSQPGSALLPGKLLSQLVSKLPDAPVEVGGDSDRVELTCGRASYSVRGMSVEDFPSLPQPDDDAARGTVKADSFVRLAGQVTRAASTDEARPVLTGVRLEGHGEELVAVATDSYRLAVRRLPWDEPVEGEALVPARALSEAANAAGATGVGASIVVEDGQVSFIFDDRRLTTRLIDGTFPEYGKLLPDGYETRVLVDREPLVEALQRVAVVAMGQANTPVALTFDTGGVELAAGNQEVGDATESLPVEMEGEGLTIHFNPGFLLAGLEAAGTQQVAIELRDGLKPAVVRPHEPDGETEDFLYLLMPVRTN